LQNPNAVDGKVTVEFDHVKNGLKIDDEELKKMNSDPAYNINVSGDIKHMLADLGTDKAKEIALHGGGGNKARNERAAAIAAILESRSKIKEVSKAEQPKQTYSVVDAASASVFGRSADAAKAGSSDKTAARIAMHMAGDRTPVNSKMVSFFFGINSVKRFVYCC
jgi:peptidyl-prolyl cis-trans isomerase-like protein 2